MRETPKASEMPKASETPKTEAQIRDELLPQLLEIERKATGSSVFALFAGAFIGIWLAFGPFSLGEVSMENFILQSVIALFIGFVSFAIAALILRHRYVPDIEKLTGQLRYNYPRAKGEYQIALSVISQADIPVTRAEFEKCLGALPSKAAGSESVTAPLDKHLGKKSDGLLGDLKNNLPKKRHKPRVNRSRHIPLDPFDHPSENQSNDKSS